MEQPQPAKSHGDAVFIAGLDHLLVTDGTAGFDNGGNPAAMCALNIVAEREKRVAAQANTCDLGKPGFPCDDRICVTLNPWKQISQASTIREFNYDHPMYNFDALHSQQALPSLNGRNNTYFCGSYFGYGFHEDAVRSAVEIGKLFAIEL